MSKYDRNLKDAGIENFLNELEKLCDSYNIYIGGCGCCGSPYLYRIEENIVGSDLVFEHGHYDVLAEKKDKKEEQEIYF